MKNTKTPSYLYLYQYICPSTKISSIVLTMYKGKRIAENIPTDIFCLGDRNTGVLFLPLNFSNYFQWACITFYTKEEEIPAPPKTKKRKKQMTNDHSLASQWGKSFFSLWALSGALEREQGTEKQLQNQRLRSLPNNSATANYIATGLHLCRKGAGWGQVGKQNLKHWGCESALLPSKDKSL